jgi:hypothetical protein
MSANDRADMISRIRSQFPDLHKILFPAPTTLEEVSTGDEKGGYVISIQCVQMRAVYCPRSDQIPPRSPVPEENDSEVAISGPVCKQFSPKLSRCMPRTTFNDAFVTTPVVLEPDMYAGFCLQHKYPGQYWYIYKFPECDGSVSGTPDVGVVCPQGTVVKCRLPMVNEADKVSDFDGRYERCVQMVGPIPPVDGSNGDAFRHVPVTSLDGFVLTHGHWAKCAKPTTV